MYTDYSAYSRPHFLKDPVIMAETSLSPGVPVRLKLPDSASFMRMPFSRSSSSCLRLATRHLDASFSAEASCFVASASQIICSSSQLPWMMAVSSASSACTRFADASASALAISFNRQVSSCVFVRLSCVLVSNTMTSTFASASMSATRPSSSAFTLRCSNSNSARFLRPLSETSTCSPFRLISSICISDSCLICIISNSFWRSSFSMAFFIFVETSRQFSSSSGSQMDVIFTPVKRTPMSWNFVFRICSMTTAWSPRRLYTVVWLSFRTSMRMASSTVALRYSSKFLAPSL
mmetsp:Transcript_53760/g.172328  ORF Transcript_53760/g.172328 Transcript_53760/m.172328 type:complete len:292 (+) Transcript_53760:2-877(+)